MVGIYKITSPTNKVYIGQSRHLNKRKSDYKCLNIIGQIKIYNSLKKYGWESHKWEIIEYCESILLDEKEIYWINHYRCIKEGLNIREGGYGGGLSQETKNKISKSLKGRKNTWTKMGSKGYKYTEEQKEKMRKPRKNTWTKKLKLNPQQVKEIRDKYLTKKYTKSTLSREYNVSWGTIKNIIDKLNSYK